MIRDLVMGDDGKLSQAKLAAATGHFLFACSFFKLQVLASTFVENLWWVYGTFAVGHATVNKGMDLLQKVKANTNESNVQIAAATGSQDTPTESAVTTTTSTKVGG